MKRRCGIARNLPDNSLSSGKGRDLLGSSATPQSPSSSSLFSDGFRMAEKRNGTATSTTTTTLLSNHGNGGHSYSDTLISSNSSNGHGNSLYANCNTSGSGRRLGPEFLSPDMLDRRTGERERVRSEGGERESGEGEEVEEGLRDGLGEGMKRLEEEISSFTMFKSPAPLARCEESSIWKCSIPFCILQKTWKLLESVQSGYCQMPLNTSCDMRETSEIYEKYNFMSKHVRETCYAQRELQDRNHMTVLV